MHFNFNKVKKLLSFLLFFCTITAYAQINSYHVFFKDKKGVTFNPYNYFDVKAIERRENAGIPLSHPTDFPLNEQYIKAIKENCTNFEGESRWLNVVFIKADDQQIETISQFPFVKNISTPNRELRTLAGSKDEYIEPSYDSFILEQQLSTLEAKEFKNANLKGKGIRIAIFDAGFPNVDVHPAFNHLRANNQIIDTYDFVKNKKHVYDYSSHGTSVLSCIAGIYEGKQIGLATEAEFLLARTERSLLEPFSEEKDWLLAVEWADKNGAQIINSSLGYTKDRYFTRDMNGETSLVAQAARIAARKGILVVNAAGNSGTDKWKIIGTPADVDSVLSVGGINPYSGYHINFSSYGPNTKKQMKPNVSALGHVVAANKTNISETYGTSFASPLVAGFAACAWQSNKTLTNMQLFDELQKSSNLYPYYDYAHGFGIPKASYFTKTGSKETDENIFAITDKEGIISIVVDSALITFESEISNLNEAVEQAYMQNLLYTHISDSTGFIKEYNVIKISEVKPLQYFRSDYTKGDTIRFHINGITKEIKI